MPTEDDARRLFLRLTLDGLRVQVERGRLLVSPAEKITGQYREEVARLKPQLLELLQPRYLAGLPGGDVPEPDVPATAELVCQDLSGKTCGPNDEELHLWTWIGAERWYYASQHRPPLRVSSKSMNKPKKRRAAK